MAEIKNDGWINIITNLGRSKDPTSFDSYESSKGLTDDILSDLYCSQGLAGKIIDLLPEQMMRAGFYVNGDSDGNAIDYFEKVLDGNNKISNLLKWSRLYGGAIAVLGIDDSKTLEDPLNENNIRSFNFIEVFDRTEVNIFPTDINTDPNSKDFGTIEYYNVNSKKFGTSFRVHNSRVLHVNGRTCPNSEATGLNQYWGLSELQKVWDELSKWGSTMGYVSSIIKDFVIQKIEIGNLSQMLSAGQDKLIQQRLEILNMSKSILDMLVMDKDENYSKESSSVAGLSDLIDQYKDNLAGAVDYPITLLFGKSPSGLNSTGKSDLEMFYNKVQSEQVRKLKPILEKIFNIIYKSKNGIKEPDEKWSIAFNPLSQMSTSEMVEARRKQAETDKIYIESGVVDPEEITKSRFGGNSYSFETVVDMEARESEYDIDEKMNAEPTA